jgi:hypothetical protein
LQIEACGYSMLFIVKINALTHFMLIGNIFFVFVS